MRGIGTPSIAQVALCGEGNKGQVQNGSENVSKDKLAYFLLLFKVEPSRWRFL